MNRALLVFILISFQELSSMGVQPVIKFQPCLGPALISEQQTSFMPKIGLVIVSPIQSYFYAIENNHYYSRRNYDWPGLGKYKYSRMLNITAISAGAAFWKSKIFSFYTGLNWSYVTGKGKFVSGNSDIKIKMQPDYTVSFGSFSPYFRGNFRISNQWSVYASYYYIYSSKAYWNIFGIGAGYNILDLE